MFMLVPLVTHIINIMNFVNVIFLLIISSFNEWVQVNSIGKVSDD